MELKLEKANINTIPDAPRVALTMLNEPFYFTRYKGVLYINEDLSGLDKIAAATYGFLLGMEYGKKMGGNGHE